MSLFAAYEPGASGEKLESVQVRRALPRDVEALVELTIARSGGTHEDLKASYDRETTGRFSEEENRLWVAQYAADTIAFGRCRWIDSPPEAPPKHIPEGWYLGGVIVTESLRRRGVARQLTAARLLDLSQNAGEVFYFVNARNRPSIDLHSEFGFVEVTRDFEFPRVSFTGGEGILFRLDLERWPESYRMSRIPAP